MTPQKHTPGPWAISARRIQSSIPNLKVGFIDPDDTTQVSTTSLTLKINERARSCVQALAGVKNPEEFVAAAKQAVTTLRMARNLLGSFKYDAPVEKNVLNKCIESITRADKAFGGKNE